MLNAIIRASLRHRTFVLLATALLAAYGLLSVKQLPVDVFPDLNRPTVIVLAEAPGMAPEEIEVLVTRPLETALNGAAGITKLYSTSGTGLSVIRAEFAWGTDLRFARLAVSERLQLARERMPKEVTPFLSPTSSIMGEIQLVGLTSGNEQVSQADLRTLADWTLRTRLLTIPGVSQVVVMGGDELQVQILVNADKLRHRQIPIHELRDRVSRISAASGGGFVTTGDQEWLIRNIGRILDRNEIAETPIGLHLGSPVLLKDVAEIAFAPAPKRGEASINGKAGVVLMVKKQPTADTLSVSKAIDEAIGEIARSFPAGVEVHGALFRQSDFIKASIGNVEEALRDGSVMVAIILALFLLNVRTTAITLVTIPLSLLVTAIVFRLFGVGVNTMTLGGLAIAMGELVDDAIVDVENVYRRLRENASAASPRPAAQVVFDASSEIRNSIVLATVIVVLVFVPIFALSGLEGRLFTPIGLAYIVSLLASLLISLTVTPVLCYQLLRNVKNREIRDSALVRALKSADRQLLHWTLNHPLKVIGGAAVLVAVSVAIVPFMGRDFLPSFNEGSAMIEVEAKPGISLAASSKWAEQIVAAIRSVPEVTSVARRTGRADEDDHAAGINHSEFEIGLGKSKRARAEIDRDLRDRVIAVVPKGAYMMLSQPITHRLDHVLSGLKAQVAVKAFGPDLRILRQLASEIQLALHDVPGIVDLRLESQVLFPQIKIYAMRPDLARYGIVPGDLIESLEIMLQGVPVSRIIEKERTLDVFLRLDDASRKDLDAIKAIPAYVRPTGEVVPLGAVTDIFETSGPNTIERENLQRRFAVSFNVSGRDLNSAVDDARRRISETVKVPEGYFIEFGGRYESQKRAIRMVSILGLLALAGIFVVLFVHFRSVGIMLQIMVNVPLALIGSVIAISLTDRTFSVATLIAFITLCGIASRNGIMMISHYIHLMKSEGEQFSKEMIVRGSLERLVPVLMTAFSAILALTPLLFAKDQAGKEILHPVAVVIVGGLLSSTLLDIFVTPAIFYRFGRKSAERLAAPGKDSQNNPQEVLP